MFFHGGGFVSCGIDTQNLCRSLATRARTLVLSVDYRLAPEARFPAAAHDACDAVRWAAASARDLGARAGATVAGDSAGGNLAAVAALQLRGSGIAIAHQLLLYPVVDCATEHPSYETLGNGYFLTADAMRWFKRHYFDDGADRASPLAPARRAGRRRRGAGDDHQRRIRSAARRGRSVCAAPRAGRHPVARWPGQLHGFASMLGAIDAADRVLTFGADALRRAFDLTEAR